MLEADFKPKIFFIEKRSSKTKNFFIISTKDDVRAFIFKAIKVFLFKHFCKDKYWFL